MYKTWTWVCRNVGSDMIWPFKHSDWATNDCCSLPSRPMLLLYKSPDCRLPLKRRKGTVPQRSGIELKHTCRCSFVHVHFPEMNKSIMKVCYLLDLCRFEAARRYRIGPVPRSANKLGLPHPSSPVPSGVVQPKGPLRAKPARKVQLCLG